MPTLPIGRALDKLEAHIVKVLRSGRAHPVLFVSDSVSSDAPVVLFARHPLGETEFSQLRAIAGVPIRVVLVDQRVREHAGDAIVGATHGTLGASVVSPFFKGVFAVTSAHVVAPPPFTRPRPHVRVAGRTVRVNRLSRMSGTVRADAALVEVGDWFSALQPDGTHVQTFWDLTQPNARNRLRGQRVVAHGLHGMITGRVYAARKTVFFPYPHRSVPMRDQVLIEAPFSVPGDSGALVYTPDDARAVGIVVGSIGTYSVVSPWTTVMSELRCALR